MAQDRMCLHIFNSVLAPVGDHSGTSVWNDNGLLPVTGCNTDQHIGYQGVDIVYPDGLSGLHSGLVEIGGQQFKCATATFQAKEHDEQTNFAKALASNETNDMIVVCRAWSGDERGRMVNKETRVYWTKLISAQYIQFGVFAAAITSIDAKGGVNPSTIYDYSTGNSKGVQTPAGRLTSVATSPYPPPGLGNLSPDVGNSNLLEVD